MDILLKCEFCGSEELEVMNEEVNEWNGEVVMDCYCYNCEKCSVKYCSENDSII